MCILVDTTQSVLVAARRFEYMAREDWYCEQYVNNSLECTVCIGQHGGWYIEKRSKTGAVNKLSTTASSVLFV